MAGSLSTEAHWSGATLPRVQVHRQLWNKPEATAKAFHEGFIVDRKKDIIIVSGYKVWPREVEDALYQHPSVKEAAVIGVADERGETVKAFGDATVKGSR